MTNPLDERNETRDEWDRAIEQNIFSHIDRQILRLRLLDGYTIAEVAEAVGLSLEQTKKRLYRAQDRLFRKTTK